MNPRKILAVVILLSAVPIVVADDKAKEDAMKQELKKLQGTWQVTKFIDHSEEAAPADEIKNMSMEFKENQLTMRQDKDHAGKENKFTLEPSKTPKWIDVDMGSIVAEGIYKLDGDELTLCIVGGTRNGKAAPRPSEFKARKREKYSLLVLKKIKR